MMELQDRAAILAWRKEERARLIEARLAIPAETRLAFATAIAACLDELLGEPAGRLASIYWPFRGEPDLRGWAAHWIGRGGRIALPVVIAKATPLEFRRWQPGDRLEKGIWNIPVPVEGGPVSPEIVVAPLVGFDPEGYRLGYGGGFFDRTLEGFAERPLTIGVGYSAAALATIRPLPHDIPMHRIVTENGIDHSAG